MAVEFLDVQHNKTFSPKYKIKVFIVRFLDFDDSVISEQEIEWENDVSFPSEPTREGYTFNKWSKDGKNIKQNLDIKAIYDINKFTVKFYSDGKLLKTEEVDYGKSATAPNNPFKSGMKFDGWDKDFNNITSNLEVNALFSNSLFTVRFFGNYLSNDYRDFIGENTPMKVQEVPYGGKATPPTNTYREGCDFIGWNHYFSSGSNMNYVTQDMDIEGIWQQKIYTVNFYVKGKLDRTIKVKYGQSAFYFCYQDGFISWDKDVSCVKSSMNVNAVFENKVIKYIVKFYNGTTLLKQQEVEKGKSATAPNDPSKSGYTFVGWDKSYSNVTSNLTINALFNKQEINTPKEEKFTVIFYVHHSKTKIPGYKWFNNYSWKVIKTEKVSNGKSATPPTNVPKPPWDATTDNNYKKYWLWCGWSEDYKNITADTEIYARWEDINYGYIFGSIDIPNNDGIRINLNHNNHTSGVKGQFCLKPSDGVKFNVKTIDSSFYNSPSRGEYVFPKNTKNVTINFNILPDIYKPLTYTLDLKPGCLIRIYLEYTSQFIKKHTEHRIY